MEINQMYYLVNIVENDFNITAAAKRIHISQPALSKFINNFEKEENIQLFNRQSGRLISLTNAGELVYTHAKAILSKHSLMLRDLRELSHFKLGEIKIGVPPIILSILMTKPISQIVNLNQNMKVALSEDGSYDIQKKLYADSLDIGILMSSNDLNKSMFNEHVIFDEELVAFISPNHPLLENKTEFVWEDLDNQRVAMLDNTFMIHHLLNAKFNQYQTSPKIVHKAHSWDYLFEVAKNSDLITILPETVKRIAITDNLQQIRMKDPIRWRVSIVYPKKQEYTRIEKYVIHSLVNYFTNNEDSNEIKPLEESAEYPIDF